MKRKIIERLFIFFVGLPFCLAIVALFPQRNHLAANFLIIIVSALGSVELAGMLAKKNFFVSNVEAFILGMIIPVGMTLLVSFKVDPLIIPMLIIASSLWLLVRDVFSNEKRLENFIERFVAGLAVMFYPSVFLSWVILMNRLPLSTFLIIAFLCIVILNDSMAWLAGMLFGKNNRGKIAASPNKSIAGFVSGMIFSMLSGLALALLLPGVFSSAHFSPVVSGLVLGCVTGIAAILGDLAESAIKRSANIKDSGSIIPGRGGILDSVDAVSLSAPVFYIVYRLLFV